MSADPCPNGATLHLRDLCHRYEIVGRPEAEARVVLGIPDWQVAEGQQVLIRGVSGSGKTTLFNVIAGLLRPSTGTVCLQGQDLYALPEGERDRWRAGRIGYVFQNHYLLPGLTALENVEMPMAFARRFPPAEWRPRAAALLEQLGLGEYLSYRPAQLSTGQRLRVAVARALANEPRILLADEPTASLDGAAAEVVMDLLQAICRESDAVLLLASHDPALNARFSTIVNLRDGELLPEEVPA